MPAAAYTGVTKGQGKNITHSRSAPTRRLPENDTCTSQRIASSALALVVGTLLFLFQSTLVKPGQAYGPARAGARHPELVWGGDGAAAEGIDEGGHKSGLREQENLSNRPLPRILIVLTTYGGRSQYIKQYREALKSGGQLGDGTTMFVVSDEEDDDPDGLVDFKTGPPQQHRLLAAVAEAVDRFKRTFEWIAIGDDDTVFLNNRAATFLSHIDHTQPLAIAAVDGLNSTGKCVPRPGCFSPAEKQRATNWSAINGCCNDFAHPCRVPVYPKRPSDIDPVYFTRGYGGSGLFWPYGGTGFFLSSGAVAAIGGARGFTRCARLFHHVNTDIQAGACLKLHGLSMGYYPEGFHPVTTADPDEIRTTIASDCQILGVHLGIQRQHGDPYTPEAFGAAVAAVREVDDQWTWSGEELENTCSSAWASLALYN